MLYLFIGIAGLAMIPVGIYLYILLKRMAGTIHIDTSKKLVKAVLIILAVVIAGSSINLFSLTSAIVLHIIAISVVMELIHLLVKRVGKNKKKSYPRFETIYRSGLIPILLTIVIFTYGYWNIHHVIETDYTVTTDKSMPAEGYQIALISDLHFGNTMDGKVLTKYCEEVSEKAPDMVVLCGDIVDERTTLEQMQEAIQILSTIKNKDGIFYVYGNHDRASYSSHPNFTVEQLKSSFETNGIQILLDKSVVINDEIIVVGRNDRAYGGTSNRKSSEELIQNLDTSKYVIMLDHQPVDIKKNAKAGYDLQLSGHTHAGQLWPVGLISDVLGFGELNYGIKQIDDFYAIVSSGIAGWGYPFRTGKHSEYVMITIQN